MLTNCGLRALLGGLTAVALSALPASAADLARGYRVQHDCACLHSVRRGPPVRRPPPLAIVPRPYYVVDQGPSFAPPIGARVLYGRHHVVVLPDEEGGFGWFPPPGYGYAYAHRHYW